MSWVIVGHAIEGTFPTEGHATARAWQLADRAGELVRAEVRQQVIPESSRGSGLDLTSLAEPESIAHAIGEKIPRHEFRRVGASMTVSREAMLGPGFSLERNVWDWLSRRLQVELDKERATVVGELERSVYERPELWSTEYRLSGQATKRGGWI